MSQESDSKKNNKNRHQISEIQNDPTNVFKIENPQVLPPLTKASKDALKELLHTTNIKGFNQKSQSLVDLLIRQKKLKEMLIKIKELNVGQKQELPKYSIELFPVYQKFQLDPFISYKDVKISGAYRNLTSESFKDFMAEAKWNYRKNQFSIMSKLNFYGPWGFKAQQKWGKPLDKKWVTDQRNFSISYILPKDSRRSQDQILDSNLKSQLYWKMKGYDTRIKRTQPEEPGIYKNPDLLKKIDILEAGYERELNKNDGTAMLGFKLGLGSDYYHTWYYKMRARGSKIFTFNKKLGASAYGQLGLIYGDKVIPHEMFSRNQTKWMGERSRLYSFCRFDLLAPGILFFESLQIVPSNYLKLWVSQSYQYKSKLELELGISFTGKNTPFRLDFNFFRLSGIHGEPRFGLKYQF